MMRSESEVRAPMGARMHASSHNADDALVPTRGSAPAPLGAMRFSGDRGSGMQRRGVAATLELILSVCVAGGGGGAARSRSRARGAA